jgi:hypothetical protein
MIIIMRKNRTTGNSLMRPTPKPKPKIGGKALGTMQGIGLE